MVRLSSFSLSKWKFVGIVALLLALVSVAMCETHENIIVKHATESFSVKKDLDTGMGNDKDVKSHEASAIDLRDVNLTDGVDTKGDEVDEDITRHLKVKKKRKAKRKKGKGKERGEKKGEKKKAEEKVRKRKIMNSRKKRTRKAGFS